MIHIAVIPARKGSKSVPDKNLQRIGGRTLIDRAIHVAKESGLFKDIILSTDIPIAIEEYENDDEVSVHKRAEEMCSDEALMMDVVLDVIQNFNLCELGEHKPCYLWLLQPSSPGRTSEDIKMIERIIKKESPASVISMTSVGAYHPSRMYTVLDGRMYPFSGKHTNFLNKQNLTGNIFIRNGCFYVVDVNHFKNECKKKLPNRHHPNAFQLHPCIPYVMEESRSINIDSKLDLELARLVFK